MDNFSFLDAHERILSPMQAYKFGLAVGSSVKEESKIAVGFCKNRGSDIYAYLISSAISACGSDCYLIPESEIFLSSYGADVLSARCYIHICSESHVSVYAGGKSGSGLDKDFLNEITNRYHSNDFKTVLPHLSGKIKIVEEIKSLYEAYLSGRFKNIKGIRATVKTSSVLLANLFDEIIRDKNDLNAEETVFNFSLDCKKVSAYSEKTGYVFYETLLMLAAKIELEKGAEIMVPKYFPSAANRLSGRLIRAENRERLIVDENNRFLTDSFYLMMMILDYMGKNSFSLEEALSDVPKVYFSQRFIYTGDNSKEKMDKMISSKFLNENSELSNNLGKARARLDKTQRGILLFADALSFEAASSLCDEIENYVKRINLDKDE